MGWMCPTSTRSTWRCAGGGGVDVWHMTVGSGLRAFADVHDFVDSHADEVAVVRTVEEMREAASANKVGLLLGWQDANAVSTGRDGPNDWWGEPTRTELRAYYELGLRVCGIAYQIANVFGGGATDGHVGLSRAGRALVEEIHRLGIVLDVGGHTGDQASFDALEMSSGVPVICSPRRREGAGGQLAEPERRTDRSDREDGRRDRHRGHKRLPGARQGYGAHDGEPVGRIDDFIAHVEHVRDLVGPDHVGLGTDFTSRPGNPNGREMRDKALFGSERWDDGPRRYVQGFRECERAAECGDGAGGAGVDGGGRAEVPGGQLAAGV